MSPAADGTPVAPANPIVRRLTQLQRLDPATRAVIDRQTAQPQRSGAGAPIWPAKDGARDEAFLLSGWAAWRRTSPAGHRQIVAIVLPGDPLFPVLPGWDDEALSLVALTAVSHARLPSKPARALASAAAGLQHQRVLDHLVRLGQLSAYDRVAHAMLEFADRLEQAGLTAGRHFALPITQRVLAEFLGLSTIHLSRTLQTLRRDELLVRRGGVVTLLDRERLSKTCDYRPAEAPPDTGSSGPVGKAPAMARGLSTS